MVHFNFDELLENRPNSPELRLLIKSPNFFETPDSIHPRAQSKKIDKILGFQIAKIEMALLKKYKAYYKEGDEGDRKQRHHLQTETWIGLHPQVLQTPYSEMLQFFKLLKNYNINRVVDLGAGYGRLAIVMKSLFPNALFTGFEIMDVRLNEAKRMFEVLELNECEMVEADILQKDFVLPDAELYFIYDFSNPNDVKKILDKLSSKLRDDKFFLIAKGDGIRSLIQLRYPQFWSVNGVIHKKNWSLYSSFVDLCP